MANNFIGNLPDALLKTSDVFSDFIVDGMQWAIPGSASLSTNMSSGTAWLNGVRTLVPDVSGNAFPASSDTYVSFNNSGVPAYQSVTNGATSPTPNSGFVQTSKVVTSPIQSPTATLSTSTSGSLASGTYGVALVAFDATGYGAVGASGTVSVTSAQSGSGSIEISWVNPLNESSMSIYATTAGSTTLGLVASGVTGNTYTYTGSVAPGVAPPTVATSNAVQIIDPKLYTKGSFRMSVLQFGADPTGVNDSTQSIQNAINSGILYFPSGIYKISGPIFVQGSSMLYGDGPFSTTFNVVGSYYNCFIFSLSGSGIRNVGFTSPTQRVGYFVKFYTNSSTDIQQNYVSDFFMENGSGIHVSGPNTTLTYITNGNLYAITQSAGIGINIDGGAGTIISGLQMNNSLSSQPFAGIYLTGGGGIVVSNTDCVRCGTGLLVTPNSQGVNFLTVHDSFFDTCETNGINVSPTSSGSVEACILDNVWASATGSAGNGIGINVNPTSTNGVNGIEILTPRCFNNYNQGIYISGNTAFTKISGGQVAGNSVSTSGAYSGIDINVSNFSVTGVFSGEVAGSSNTQDYGIKIASGATNFICNDNFVLYNINPGILFGGVLTQTEILKNNIGSPNPPVGQSSNIIVSSTTTAGSITATASQLVGGYLADGATQTAAFTVTTDTAANILAAMPNAAVGTSFEFRFINNDQSSTGYAGTLAGGTGVTIGTVLPNPAVPKGGYEDYVFTFTAIGSTPALTVEAVGGNSTALL